MSRVLVHKGCLVTSSTVEAQATLPIHVHCLRYFALFMYICFILQQTHHSLQFPVQIIIKVSSHISYAAWGKLKLVLFAKKNGKVCCKNVELMKR